MIWSMPIEVGLDSTLVKSKVSSSHWSTRVFETRISPEDAFEGVANLSPTGLMTDLYTITLIWQLAAVKLKRPMPWPWTDSKPAQGAPFTSAVNLQTVVDKLIPLGDGLATIWTGGLFPFSKVVQAQLAPKPLGSKSMGPACANTRWAEKAKVSVKRYFIVV